MTVTHQPVLDIPRPDPAANHAAHRAQTSCAFDLRRSLTEEGTEIRAGGQLIGIASGRLLELAVTGMLSSGGTVFDENAGQYIESIDQL